MADKKRLQFDFSEEALEEIDDLQKLTGLPTRSELIRHALRFLQWTLAETQDDKAMLLLEKNGERRQIVFPFWAPFTPVSRSGETARKTEMNAAHT